MIMKFILRMLNQFMEKQILTEETKISNKRSSITTDEFHKFGNVIGKMLSSKQDELVHLSLKLYKNFNDFGREIKSESPNFFKNVISLLTKTTAMNSELIETIFSVLNTNLFQFVKSYSFIDFQIVFHVLKEYMYISDEVKSPLMYLNHIIKDGIIKVEVYDLIPGIFEIFYETQNEFFEAQSRDTILLFLKVYPIDDLLLVKFTIDLIKHIDLEGDFKRSSVTDFLIAIFEKNGVDFCEEFVS